MLNNQHVYVYWRWKGWVAKHLNRLMAMDLFWQWAVDERQRQLDSEVDDIRRKYNEY